MIKTNLLTKSFKIRNEVKYVLKNVSLTINQGEYVAIIGKSGAGKSTLLNIIAGLDSQTYGDYFFEDRQIVSNKQRSNIIRNECSMIMQNFALVENMTVIQNIYLKKKDKNKANELLEKLQILHIKNQKIKNCSGGEKQRVAIARALMTDCKVLLADEPTGALDSESGSQIMEILQDLNSLGITIVLVTHDLGFANQAKRTLELSDGRIIDDRLNQK